MIKVIQDMPPGTLGLEAIGKVTEEDYRDVLAPAVAKAVEGGDGRLLYLLGKDFESYSGGAVWADAKMFAQHPKGWTRIAVVTDADWVEHSITAFGWLMPGKLKTFETDDLTEAKAWLVDIELDDD